MNRAAYYDKMQVLANEVRARYRLTTPRVLRSDLRRIYKDQGIRIDLWPHPFKELRGAYFDDDLGPTVLLRRGLPEDPMVFTMAHELKHHLTDRDKVLSVCSARNEQEPIEIGAEVFAAEFIFPEQDFRNRLREMGVDAGQCTPEVIVRLKHESRTTLSFTGLAKRARRLGYSTDLFLKVPWKKLEEKLYGVPFYRRRQER